MLHYLMMHHFHVALVVAALFNFVLFWYITIKCCTILLLHYINVALAYIALLILYRSVLLYLMLLFLMFILLRLPYVMLHYLMLHFSILHYFDIALFDDHEIGKINSLKVHRVFYHSISLMTLIVPTFLSVSGYFLKGTNCWKLDFSLNFFSRNILRRFYPKTGNPIPQKCLIVKISAKKPMVNMII